MYKYTGKATNEVLRGIGLKLAIAKKLTEVNSVNLGKKIKELRIRNNII